MPITKRSRRYMTELAREVAKLHNDAAAVARWARTLAGKVQELEEELRSYKQAAKGLANLQ